MSLQEQPNPSGPAPAPSSGAGAIPALPDLAADQSLGFLAQIQTQLETVRALIAQNNQRMADNEVRAADVNKRAEQVEAREKALKARVAEFDAQMEAGAAELDARAAQLDELKRRAEEQLALAEESRAKAEADGAVAKAREESLAARDEHLAAQERELAKRAEESTRQSHEGLAAAQARAAELELRLEALRAEAEAAKAAADGAAEHLRLEREQTEQLRMRLSEIEKTFAASRTQTAEQLRQAGQAAKEHAAQIGEAVARFERAESALSELRLRLAGQQESAEHQGQAEAHLLSEIKRATERAEEAERKAGAIHEEFEAKLAEAAEQLSAARAEASAGAASGGSSEEAGKLRDELAIRDKALAELARRAKSAEAALAERDGQVRELREAPGLGAVGEAGELIERAELRRMRLAKYKRLLHEQSNKIVKAKAAIKKRAEECEAVLSQRAKLADALGALENQKRAVAARAAKTGAAAIVTYAMVTLAAVSGLAWGVARQVAPATYAARAELAADGKGRELTASELGAWTETHKALLDDPQVLAAAAENYARRGIPELGTATAVKTRLQGALYVQSDKPGEIALEYRGEGVDRAARELETFMSAVLTVSNAQREARGDGAATTISKQPVSGADPVDSARLTYALAMAGGGAAVSCGLGFLAYRALRNAKAKFEEDTAGSHIMG